MPKIRTSPEHRNLHRCLDARTVIPSRLPVLGGHCDLELTETVFKRSSPLERQAFKTTSKTPCFRSFTGGAWCMMTHGIEVYAMQIFIRWKPYSSHPRSSEVHFSPFTFCLHSSLLRSRQWRSKLASQWRTFMRIRRRAGAPSTPPPLMRAVTASVTGSVEGTRLVCPLASSCPASCTSACRRTQRWR